MTQRDVSEWVQDWWGFTLFIVGTVAAFWMGTKRREWQLQQAVKDIEELSSRIRDVEREQHREETNISRITTAMENIIATQNRILDAISVLQRDKADR